MDSSEKVKARRRLPRVERERLIIDEAVKFFAEVGFEGQTRALADRLGVTQPLLYRYFPDKESLIERVYSEVFEGGWDSAWETRLSDRTRPLSQRIIEFYRAYISVNFNFERVRLFLFAGLKDQAIANRYLDFVRQHLFVPLCRELRAEAGLPERAPTEAEIECVAGLHGAVGYVGMRRWVYNAPVPEDLDGVISALVTSFLAGAPQAFRDLALAKAGGEG